jgi:type I restriction enzyme S subunit
VLLKTERHLTDFGVSKVSSGILDVGTVLMSSRAPIGYLAVTKTPTTVNQGIIAMKPNEKYSSEFILCWTEVNQEEVVARANGSTFLEISKKNFREIPFVEPTDDCAKKFGILAKEYFDRIEILSKENKQLESLRDTLLPKLISGELRIPDTEAQVEEAI